MNPTVGLFGIGLNTYWAQFPGLEERLIGYQTGTRTMLEEAGASVVDAGLVDTVEKARAAGVLFREKEYRRYFCTSRPMHCRRLSCRSPAKPGYRSSSSMFSLQKR